MSVMHSLAKTYIRQYAANTIGNSKVENKFLNI